MKAWKYLPLNKGHRAKVDSEDWERIDQYTWRVRTRKDTDKLSVITSIREGDKVRTLSLGKFLMKPKKGKLVYPRRYQDALDFRKNNLIVCTPAERQQMLPQGKKGSSSSYRGVSYINKSSLWRAAIQVDGQSINLGEFKNEDMAAKAYNKASHKYFKDYAYQNQIRSKSERRQK